LEGESKGKKKKRVCGGPLGWAEKGGGVHHSENIRTQWDGPTSRRGAKEKSEIVKRPRPLKGRPEAKERRQSSKKEKTNRRKARVSEKRKRKRMNQSLRLRKVH